MSASMFDDGWDAGQVAMRKQMVEEGREIIQNAQKLRDRARDGYEETEQNGIIEGVYLLCKRMGISRERL